MPRHLAEAIIAVSKSNQASLGALTDAEVVNVFLFPPQTLAESSWNLGPARGPVIAGLTVT